RAHAEFRWFAGGWKVNSELPHPDSFEAATRFVRPEDVASTIPCGDDPDDFVEAVRPYAEAGFTEIALVQVGGESQPAYLDWAEKTPLPALRNAFGWPAGSLRRGPAGDSPGRLSISAGCGVLEGSTSVRVPEALS